MKIPENVQTNESDLGVYWFDGTGILYCQSKSPKRTVENIKANALMIQRITNNERACLLIFLTSSPIPDKETQRYVKEQLPKIYKAMAMVSDSGVGKIIMNVLFSLKKPPIPMKTFSDEPAARNWLKQYL